AGAQRPAAGPGVANRCAGAAHGDPQPIAPGCGDGRGPAGACRVGRCMWNHGPMAATLELSAAEARRTALRAQGLLGAPDRRAGVAGVLHRLGAIQLDTISVLARSHELIAYARLGPVGRVAVESAYWSGGAFEYWAHAASIIPLEDWPWFQARRVKARRDPKRQPPARAADEIRR